MSNILHNPKSHGPVPDGPKSDVLVHVSQNLRRFRHAAGMSQQALADASGISRRMIVGVENGEANVSLASLDRLAIALGVDFTAMVKGPGAEPRNVNETMWRGADPADFALLLGSVPAQQEAQLWVWSLAPDHRYQAEPDPAGWHEIIYVTQGRLALELESETVLLNPGEFRVFPSDQHYAYANAGEDVTHFLRNSVL